MSAFDRLKKLLNPAIKGKMTDALLEALAVGDDLNDFNIRAVNDQLFISTASRRFLDKLASNRGFVRPLNIGLSDNAFRELTISTTSNKQITSVLLDVLEVFYGPEAVRASMISAGIEPYSLLDGDQLIIENESGTVTITFKTSEFTDISQATAKEVGASITRQLRDLRNSEAELLSFAVDFFDADTQTTSVQLVSGVKGTVGSIRILGGAAQNKLQFPLQLQTFQAPGTKWDITEEAGSTIRYTWIADPAVTITTQTRTSGLVATTTAAPHGFVTGQRITVAGTGDSTFNGNFVITSTPTATTFEHLQSGLPDGPSAGGTAVTTSPGLGILQAGDIVNIFGTEFDIDNLGAFEITNVVDGIPGSAFFEIFNELGVAETVTQDSIDDLTFMRPIRTTILSDQRFAAVFEVAPNVIQIFLPATTQVTERLLEGAAHIHADASDTSFLGPYLYDPTSGGVLTGTATTLTSSVQAGRTARILDVVDSSAFPDEEGFLIFGFGTSKEEKPIKYIGRPGNKILLADPAHTFQNDHNPGTDITLLSTREPVDPKIDGSDLAFYLTGTANGRIFAENLIGKIVATGLTLIITVIYPGDVGLGNEGFPAEGDKISDKTFVWGGDPN